MKSNIWLNPNTGVLVEKDNLKTSPRKLHAQLPFYEPSNLRNLDDVAKQLQIRSVSLKDESDRFGLPSFKILGASWGCFCAITYKLNLPTTTKITDLKQHLKDSNLTIYAATDGNHGRAVAFMAGLLGIKAVILVPDTLDGYTQQAIRSSGGIVIPVTAEYDGVVKEAERLATSEDDVLIQDTSWPGYEEVPAWIVDGYSTIFAELEEQLLSSLGAADFIVVPVGVGSLAHATVLNLKNRTNAPQIVAVEPKTAACLNTSLHANRPTSISTSFTIMTGMNCGTVSHSAWDDLKRGIDISLTISDSQAHDAVEYLRSIDINAGPCGAACLAAVIILAEQKLLSSDSRVVVINTEGRRPYSTFGISKHVLEETRR